MARTPVYIPSPGAGPLTGRELTSQTLNMLRTWSEDDDVIRNSANAAQQTASTALTDAANAAGAASAAQQAASAADTKAGTAQTTAESAQSTANTAKGLAETAQTTADTADGKATQAQTTANSLVSAYNGYEIKTDVNITTPGIYSVTGSALNLPAEWGLGGGQLIVTVRSDGTVNQSISGVQTGKHFSRGRNPEGIWNPWYETGGGAGNLPVDTSDCNTATTSGQVYIAGGATTNAPPGGGVWVIFVEQTSSSLIQLAWGVSTTGSLYNRFLYDGTWSAWTRSTELESLASRGLVKSNANALNFQVVADCNTTALGFGLYQVTPSTTNGPSTSGGLPYGFLVNYSSNGIIIQKVFCWDDFNRSFVRSYDGSGWTSWALEASFLMTRPTNADNLIQPGTYRVTTGATGFPSMAQDNALITVYRDVVVQTYVAQDMFSPNNGARATRYSTNGGATWTAWVGSFLTGVERITNLDVTVLSGIYSCSDTSTGFPSVIGGAGFLLVGGRSDGSIYQQIMGISGLGGASVNIASRTRSASGTWTPWSYIA